jgi:hypothetical protein
MGRKRLKRSITLKNIFYKYDYRYDTKNPYYCTSKLYENISKDFYKLLLEKVINEGFIFNLPLRLGEFKIVKFKSESKQINWNLTNLHYGEHNKNNPDDRKRIYFTNNHTEGFKTRFYWKKTSYLKYHTLYNFTPTRTNKRELAKAVNERDTIYMYQEQ